MSPEQAVGDKSIDFRSDIYALGTTLYHMLTGKVPYHATTSMAIIMKHLNDNYEAPDKLNPKISENCCKLIAIMMAKNKPERHTCWQDLLTDIDRVLDDKAPLTAIPTKKSFSKSSVDVDGLEKKDNRYLLITFAIISVIIFITILILLFSSPEKTSSVKFSNLKTIPVVVKQNDDKNLSFRSVSSMLDKTKHSEQDISKNWETILGKKFSWRGAFVLYRERFLNDPEVRVAVPFCKLYKNFNLILVTPEKDKAMKFKPGQTLSFTGIPYKYQSKKNGAVVVYMKDVKFH
jgi:serine/threonine protein kinase